MARRRIIKLYMGRGENQINSEIELPKRCFVNGHSVNFRVAVIKMIGEIENLVTSLNQAIKKFTIDYLYQS